MAGDSALRWGIRRGAWYEVSRYFPAPRHCHLSSCTTPAKWPSRYRHRRKLVHPLIAGTFLVILPHLVVSPSLLPPYCIIPVNQNHSLSLRSLDHVVHHRLPFELFELILCLRTSAFVSLIVDTDHHRRTRIIPRDPFIHSLLLVQACLSASKYCWPDTTIPPSPNHHQTSRGA